MKLLQPIKTNHRKLSLKKSMMDFDSADSFLSFYWIEILQFLYVFVPHATSFLAGMIYSLICFLICFWYHHKITSEPGLLVAVSKNEVINKSSTTIDDVTIDSEKFRWIYGLSRADLLYWPAWAVWQYSIRVEWRAKIHKNLTPLEFPKIIKSHSRGWSKYSVKTTPSISSLEKRDFLHLTRLVHQKTDCEVLCCFCCFCSLWIYSVIHILHCDFRLSKSNTHGTIGLPIHLKQASVL